MKDTELKEVTPPTDYDHVKAMLDMAKRSGLEIEVITDALRAMAVGNSIESACYQGLYEWDAFISDEDEFQGSDECDGQSGIAGSPGISDNTSFTCGPTCTCHQNGVNNKIY